MVTKNTAEQVKNHVLTALLPSENKKQEIAPYPNLDGTQPCATTDPELWFPLGSSRTYPAFQQVRELCHSCDFVKECLAYALTHHVQGIWGGMAHRERQDLVRQYNIKQIPLEYDPQ